MLLVVRCQLNCHSFWCIQSQAVKQKSSMLTAKPMWNASDRTQSMQQTLLTKFWWDRETVKFLSTSFDNQKKKTTTTTNGLSVRRFDFYADFVNNLWNEKKCIPRILSIPPTILNILMKNVQKNYVFNKNLFFHRLAFNKARVVMIFDCS